MPKLALYSELASYYDRIYWWKDYAQEVDFLLKVLHRYGVRGKRILEVACGTGNHTKLLAAAAYRVTGVDVSDDMLAIARRKVGGRATFVRGEMRNLGQVVEGTYDAAICLFSAISYNLSMSDLKRTLQGLFDHTREGGVTVFDTRFTKKGFMDGHRGEDIFDDGEAMGARLSFSRRRGKIGEITFSYLIKDGPKVILLRDDVHRLGLFDLQDFRKAMREVGFGRIAVYVDWKFARDRKQNEPRDHIFVGRKPS
ncbi:MAG: class I SAM-dependent methyltransferase [Thaumarchaeota archaeon]|nr:MAG: class I SAM-dependent methyltransferase [Nitrososphaerota archaeon]